jgi:hypothetical protein
MPRSILAPFKKKFSEDRLLAGYSNIEVGLMHCVAVTRDLDTALKAMFLKRGETKRISAAEKLGHPDQLPGWPCARHDGGSPAERHGRSRPRWPAPLVEPGAVFAHLLALRCRRVALAG